MQKLLTLPITFGNWKEIPVFSGQLATKDDVDNGKALFSTIEAEGELCEMDLPFCAFYTEKETRKKFSIVAFQAETAHKEVIIGATKIDGETVVCVLSELEIINDPDQEFFTSKTKKPWWKLW